MTNNATNFRESRAENFHTVFLGSRHFTHTCTLQPADGSAARNLQALIRPTEELSTDEHTQQQVEEIVVTLSKDPNDANGGIAQPAYGDTITLEDGRKYQFTGQVLSETPYSWRLRYRRRIQRQAGAANARRS